MGRLVRVEFFKIGKRWMPYVLICVMIVLLALFQFGIFAAYKSIETRVGDSPLPRPQQEETLETLQTLLTLPRATEGIFSTAQSAGAVLLVILTASVVGAEYAWGTVRTSLSLGVGRSRYLFSKLVTVLGLTLAGLIITFVLGFVFAIATSMLIGGSIDWGFLGGLYVPRVLAMFGRTWFVLAVPISMTVMVAVLTRSSAVGIGVGIGYPILETIVVTVLANVAGWGEAVQRYSIGYNMSGVMAWNAMGEQVVTGIGLGNRLSGSIPPFWQAASLLVGYGLAFLTVAFYFFRKNDLTA